MSSLIVLTSMGVTEITTSGWLGTGLGVVMGLATLTGYLTTSAAWKRQPARAEHLTLSPTRHATVMRYGRPQVVVTYATYATMTILFAVIPFFADFSQVRNVFRAELLVYLAPIVAVSTGPYLISPLIRKRRLLGIGLSPDGIHHWSWFGCCFYRWDAIERVEAAARRGLEAVLVVDEDARNGTDPEENWVADLPRYRRRLRRIPAGHLDANPVVAYAALKYYLDHPERRQELATDEGVRRIGQLDFPGM